MKGWHRTKLLAGLLLMVAGCALDGHELEGVDLGEVTFHVCGPDMGVYPDQSVLDDPDNPFASVDIGDEAKWRLQSHGGVVPAFYAWATLTARHPTGESQYYAALDLRAIYDGQLTSEENLPIVRDLAIRGFRAVLDHFPDSVTYDATGTVAYDLATPAYKAIIELGGAAPGWILVQTSGGGERAVHL